MTNMASHTTIFSLPTELRLQIAAYALDQSPDDGPFKGGRATQAEHTPQEPTRGLWIDTSYRAAPNLWILLVCRQFRDDFRCLALQKTWFLLTTDSVRAIADQSDELLRNVRKLAISSGHDSITSWHSLPFDKHCMKLDELILANSNMLDAMDLVRLLRRLQNVKVLRFLLPENSTWVHRLGVNQLFGAILKEDHYQRYDAPNAPNLGSTFWEFSFNQDENSYKLVAQDPKPVMEEQDYLLLVKPLIDKLMMEPFET